MTINLESFKKKNARNFCLGVSAAAKYVAAEHTCKLSLQTRYFYNSGKIFDNPSWNLSHGICLDKSIKYLKDTFEGIFLYDRESVKLKLKVVSGLFSLLKSSGRGSPPHRLQSTGPARRSTAPRGR